MRSDGIPRTPLDFIHDHGKRLDRLERRQGAAVSSGSPGTGNKTYRQDDPPTGVTLRVGDIWIDSNDNDQAYWWTGTQWLPIGWGGADTPVIIPPPTTSPDPVVSGGIGALFISWPATNAVNALVSVYVSKTLPVGAVKSNLVGTVYNSGPGLLAVRTLADGTPLVAGTLYYIAIQVQNSSGIAPISQTISGTPALINSPDLAVNAITANNLIANNALVTALEATGINANWISTGQMNAERLSIGSTTPGSTTVNGNMEDPSYDSSGNINLSGFAAWTLRPEEAAGVSMAAETVTPISGTRSARITVPSGTSPRMIEVRAQPVSGGHVYYLTALIRSDRTVDRSTVGGSIASLVLHSSSGADPSLPESGTSIIWQSISSVETLYANTVTALEGFVTIPAGHKRMKVAIKLSGAPDGSVWSATIDEVFSRPTAASLQVVNPTTSEIVASVSTDGDLLAHNIDYTGALNITEAYYLGEPLYQRFARFSQALLTWGELTPAQVAVSNVALGIMSINLYLPEDRAVQFNAFGVVDSNTVDSRYDINLHYTTSSTGVPPDATTASTQLISFDYFTSGPVGNNSTFNPSYIFNLTAGYYNFLLTLRSVGTTTTTTPRATWQMSFTDIGPIQTQSMVYIPGTPAPSGGRTYTKLYSATDSRWWNENNVMSGDSSTAIRFGDYPGEPNGNRKAAVWFDTTQIRRDLAGAVVVQADLYMYMLSGGSDQTAVVGYHTDTTVRNVYSNIAGRTPDVTRDTGWKEDMGRWFTLGGDPDGWRTTRAGLLLGPGPTGSQRFAMSVNGPASVKHPILRITYKR